MEETILNIHQMDRNIILLGDFSAIEIVNTQSQFNIKNIGTAVGIGLAGRIASRAALTLINPIGAAVIAGATDFVSIKKLLKKDKDMVFTYVKVPYKQAFDLLKWKGNLTPKKNTFYIQNLHDDKIYFPVGEFHTLTFEDKYNEAIKLLMALKPKELIVEYNEGYSRELNAKVEIKKKKIVDAKTDFKVGQGKGKEVLFSAEFEKPAFFSRAKMPSDLIWYPSEEKWHSVVDGVLNHGLKKVEMDISYNDDFGINANLQASLAKVIGGKVESKYTEFRQTLWKVNATFW